MFHQYAFSHRMGAVDGTGKRFGAVRADLFQDRRLFIHEDIPFGERITCADEVLFPGKTACADKQLFPGENSLRR